MTFAAANPIAAKLLCVLIYKHNIIMRYISVGEYDRILRPIPLLRALVLRTGKTRFFDFEGEKPLDWSR